MSKQAKIFWTSYSDLMTSLFFIMLVLFVLTIAMMKRQAAATEKQLETIKEIQNSVKELDPHYFYYQEDYKRFSLKEQIQFQAKSSVIPVVNKNYLIGVGKNIVNLISTLKTKYKGQNIKYMIIIEGMASNFAYSKNDELSYLRALSLYKLWEQNNIYFDPKFCELQIAGSGIRGVGRFNGKDEYKNQQFLIQIIPKIGKIDN